MAFYLIGLFLSWAPRVFSWGRFSDGHIFLFFSREVRSGRGRDRNGGTEKSGVWKISENRDCRRHRFYVVYGLAGNGGSILRLENERIFGNGKGRRRRRKRLFSVLFVGSLLDFRSFINRRRFSVFLFSESAEKYRERFFEEGELDLGFLSALLIGWPNFVVFVPLVFLSVVIIAVFRRVFLKELYTTLGLPMLLATLLVLAFGDFLVAFFIWAF